MERVQGKLDAVFGLSDGIRYEELETRLCQCFNVACKALVMTETWSSRKSQLFDIERESNQDWRRMLQSRTRLSHESAVEKKLQSFAAGTVLVVDSKRPLQTSYAVKASEERLAARGIFLDAQHAVACVGSASQYHQNAHDLLRNGKAAFVGTGYALSQDGLWRGHSWAHRVDGTILETTEPRLAYFGTACDCSSCLLCFVQGKDGQTQNDVSAAQAGLAMAQVSRQFDDKTVSVSYCLSWLKLIVSVFHQNVETKKAPEKGTAQDSVVEKSGTREPLGGPKEEMRRTSDTSKVFRVFVSSWSWCKMYVAW